jgi:DNA-directed RNA polymerase II subunit RPB2
MNPRPQNLYKKMKSLKQRLEVNPEVGISLDYNRGEIKFNTAAGRCTRPLFVVGDDGQLKITKERIQQLNRESMEDGWLKMMEEGLLEYLDGDEQDNALIATFPKEIAVLGPGKILIYPANNKTGFGYTHCEIHPATILGKTASFIPFPDHNPAARNSFQCAMGKQAVGYFLSSFDKRMDSLSHVLFYAQKPLVSTKAAKELGLEE